MSDMTTGDHGEEGGRRFAVTGPDRGADSSVAATGRPIRVTVWGENVHERNEPEVAERYPTGMHGAVAEGIEELLGERAVVRTATLDADAEHGLSEEVLRETDVLTWWGHAAHDQVSDEVVERVHRHVLDGMGLIVLHSGHWSKIFTRLMGTPSRRASRTRWSSTRTRCTASSSTCPPPTSWSSSPPSPAARCSAPA